MFCGNCTEIIYHSTGLFDAVGNQILVTLCKKYKQQLSQGIYGQYIKLKDCEVKNEP
ncbi:MAG: hypothetical protein RSF40_02010 [Oscillospiraceae bacterium]